MAAVLGVPLFQVLTATDRTAELSQDDSVILTDALKVLGRGTAAETREIGKLSFVALPPPHSLPVLLGALPGQADDRFGRLVQRMRDVGCVDGDNQVNVRPAIDRAAVSRLSADIDRQYPGSTGLVLARSRYHKGLLAICSVGSGGEASKAAYAEAARAFEAAAAKAEEVGGLHAEQFLYVARAGQRLALVQSGAARSTTLPDLPAPPAGLFTAARCTANDDASDCHLFSWPPVRHDLARVQEFLATPDADPEDFRVSINNGYDNNQTFGPYNFFTFVAARAKAGQFEEVKAKVAFARKKLPEWEADEAYTATACDHLNRMIILAWLAGDTREEQPGCGDPMGVLKRGEDSDAVESAFWTGVRGVRPKLESGDFSGAEASVEAAASPMVEEVKDDLLRRLAAELARQRDAAIRSGDLTTAERIDGLLDASHFDWLTRLRYSLSWWTLALMLAVPLLVLPFAYFLRDKLIGYSLAFPSRHRSSPSRTAKAA
jgi:hypothetical protein